MTHTVFRWVHPSQALIVAATLAILDELKNFVPLLSHVIRGFFARLAPLRDEVAYRILDSLI